MKFNSKKYFKNFLQSELNKNNAQEIYEIFYTLEVGEKILFRNCCKLLNVDREKFFDNFVGMEEVAQIDEETDYGYTTIAAAEKYGSIEYEFPDEPSYGSIKNVTFDQDNEELIEFNYRLFSAAAHEIVDSLKESDHSESDILYIVGRIGVFKDKQRRCLYEHTANCLAEIETEMDKFNLRNSLNEHGKPADSFIDNFKQYHNSLGGYRQPEALLALAGVAKGIVAVVELAGHDCLPTYRGNSKLK